jgi:VanZ family protein
VNWRWTIWIVFALAWTVALVAPVPETEELPFGELLVTRKVLFAKSVHVAAYAVFAVLTGWLPVPLRWRPLLMFLLMFHGAATEFIQLHLVYRSGLLSDVLLDHLGIALGWCASWKWWIRDHV